MWEELSRTEGRRGSSRAGRGSLPTRAGHPLGGAEKAWSTVNGCGLRPPWTAGHVASLRLSVGATSREAAQGGPETEVQGLTSVPLSLEILSGGEEWVGWGTK